MSERPSPQISSRKQPKQARSTELVAAVLEAAVQVLATQGAARFTVARVAERAGVSVGSVYQYFPNKAAILFRLQSEFAKSQFDSIVAESSKVSEAVLKLAGEMFEPLSTRYSVAAERVKSAIAA